MKKQREQIKPSVIDQYQYDMQRSEDDDGDHDVLQLSITFASLKEQLLFYGDDDPIDYHNLEVEQGSP
jgi:hypothetical protein